MGNKNAAVEALLLGFVKQPEVRRFVLQVADGPLSDERVSARGFSCADRCCRYMQRLNTLDGNKKPRLCRWLQSRMRRQQVLCGAYWTVETIRMGRRASEEEVAKALGAVSTALRDYYAITKK